MQPLNLRRVIYGLFLILFTGNVFSQTTSRQMPIVNLIDNPIIERYGVDYVIKGMDANNIDSAIIYLINFDKLEQYRSNISDVEVLDENTGLNVILFRKRKVQNIYQLINNED